MNNVQLGGDDSLARILNLKEHILSTAKTIAAKEGIDKINVRRVAKESGIAIGTIYNYYPAKGDIIADVIEDFWKQAFSNIDLAALQKLDFISAIEKLYYEILNYLVRFKENWLEQLTLLSINNKNIGRAKEKEYLNKIYFIITMWLEQNDKVIKSYSPHERAKLAEFIFENMLSMLKRNEKDFSFFKKILCEIID